MLIKGSQLMSPKNGLIQGNIVVGIVLKIPLDLQDDTHSDPRISRMGRKKVRTLGVKMVGIGDVVAQIKKLLKFFEELYTISKGGESLVTGEIHSHIPTVHSIVE